MFQQDMRFLKAHVEATTPSCQQCANETSAYMLDSTIGMWMNQMMIRYVRVVSDLVFRLENLMNIIVESGAERVICRSARFPRMLWP